MRLPMMITGIAVVIGSFVFCSPRLMAGVGLFTAKPMMERQLPLSLSAILCARQATAEDLIKNGVYDAQVQAVRLTPKGSQKITQQQILDRARKLISDSNQISYAYGLCGDGGAWAVGFTVSDPVTVENNSLKIPASLPRMCVPGTLKALFSPEARGRSLGLAISKNNFASLPDQKGYASVSCVMIRDRNDGPRELALVPVAGASIDATAIGKKSFSNIEGSLSAWVNERRKLENLPPLAESEPLNGAAKSLIGKRKISHDVEALGAMRKFLNAKGIEPQGEDRVMGRDINELAGLLWMSPSHRDLVLSPSADVIGLAINKNESSMFAVLVVGKRSGGSVARSLAE